MIRKRKRRTEDDVLVSEVYRADVPLPDKPMTMIIYDCWAGNLDREDIRTEVERRTAWFALGEAPADLQAAADDSSEHYYYKGIPGAINDAEIITIQESDGEAEDMASDEERLRRIGTWQTREETVPAYELFLQAIERIAHDESDKEAWETIDNHRYAQLKITERDAKQI